VNSVSKGSVDLGLNFDCNMRHCGHWGNMFARLFIFDSSMVTFQLEKCASPLKFVVVVEVFEDWRMRGKCFKVCSSSSGFNQITDRSCRLCYL